MLDRLRGVFHHRDDSQRTRSLTIMTPHVRGIMDENPCEFAHNIAARIQMQDPFDIPCASARFRGARHIFVLSTHYLYTYANTSSPDAHSIRSLRRPLRPSLQRDGDCVPSSHRWLWMRSYATDETVAAERGSFRVVMALNDRRWL